MTSFDILFKITHAHRNLITQDVPAPKEGHSPAPLFLQTWVISQIIWLF